MEKVWLQHYPANVPQTIDTSPYPSLLSIFHASVQQFRHQPAYSNMGRVLTYQELDRLTRDFAAYLHHEAGLRHGDRIAIMMPNLLQYPVALFGAFRAGLIVVNTNPLYTERELRHQLQDAGVKAIVIMDSFAHVLEKVLPDTSLNTIIQTGAGDLLGGLKGWLVNFVVRHVKKMVPAYALPTAVSYRQALR